MRKILLSTTLFFASLGFIFSQPCTITNIDTSFIAPSVDSLPCIERGQAYSNSIQINMPGGFDGLVTLDSLVITAISGLPAGITYASNPSSNVYYANTSGCIGFTGTTNDTAAGYELYFQGYAVVTSQGGGTQTLTLAQLSQIHGPVPSFQLNVINPGDSCHPLSLSSIAQTMPSVNWNVYPNPSNGSFQLTLGADKNQTTEITVTDISGRIVHAQKTEATETNINLSGLSKGLYTLQLRTRDGVACKNIVID